VSALTLRRWTVEEWLSNEVAWSQLLAGSNADPLFLSWEWQTRWWQCYGAPWVVLPKSWLLSW